MVVGVIPDHPSSRSSSSTTVSGKLSGLGPVGFPTGVGRSIRLDAQRRAPPVRAVGRHALSGKPPWPATHLTAASKAEHVAVSACMLQQVQKVPGNLKPSAQSRLCFAFLSGCRTLLSVLFRAVVAMAAPSRSMMGSLASVAFPHGQVRLRAAASRSRLGRRL